MVDESGRRVGWGIRMWIDVDDGGGFGEGSTSLYLQERQCVRELCRAIAIAVAAEHIQKFLLRIGNTSRSSSEYTIARPEITQKKKGEWR